MTRFLIGLLAASAASPALAQHAGHPPPPPAEAQPEPDPHAGHDFPAESADPHAGHDMSGQRPPAPAIGPPPAAALAGPEHAADTVYGAEAMRASRRELLRTHGRLATHRLRFERLELGFGDGQETYGWEADFFYGPPLDRLWIKTEGEGAFARELGHAEVQALWGHAIGPYFDLQAGLRYDFAPDPERAHLVLGVQGLAPYWIEVDGALFLSDEGEASARIEAEHDVRITQRLILQPLLELELSLQDVPELAIGSGLSTLEGGLRLRYEIAPEFAPYVGVRYERSLGDTAELRRLAGKEESGWSLVAGIRAWF